MKTNILKSNNDFNKIIKEGKKVSNSHFIVYSLPSLSLHKKGYSVGISVGKKIGKAHVRNKQKRIVRHLLLEKDIVIPNKQMVIISRPVCLSSSYEIQKKKIYQLLLEGKK